MLTKNIFRTEVKEIILDYMVKGTVRPGERLSLPTISATLDVSVTPIREALTQLTETGIVTYKANRGFFVTELSKQEASEIYEAIALLEGEAVKKSSFTEKQLLELQEINTAFSKTESPKRKLRLDRKFHQKLIENYENQYVQKIIEDIRIRIFIYELEFMMATPASESAAMHDEIILMLQTGKKSSAVKKLKANWDLSINHIINIYQSKQS